MMENKTEKTKKVMANVMAALNTFGVEYDTNVWGYEVERRRLFLGYGEETVDYIGYDGGDNFKAKFEEFANKPHYHRLTGAYWTDDDEYVIIQLSRCYEMDEEDWQEYARQCGCEDPLEAQCIYGDPSPSNIRMNVRIRKGNISSFVERYAKYCW